MASENLREIGEILECRIGGKHTRLRRIEGAYDYAGDLARCGVCGSVGTPWGGLFHCDGPMTDPPHVCVVETGQCFALEEPTDG